MAWPLHWGGKIKDGCLRCPLHQSSYHPEDGSVNEWSPAPYFPLYGKMLGKLRKPSSLKTYEVREKDGYVEIDMNS
jgi:nitrite reductase/ring-hydroxylating ferredoxin subunit